MRGGLCIDGQGGVLNQQGARIDGLYAIGDVAATIFGETYPGGGCAIGSAMLFGYLAAALTSLWRVSVGVGRRPQCFADQAEESASLGPLGCVPFGVPLHREHGRAARVG